MAEVGIVDVKRWEMRDVHWINGVCIYIYVLDVLKVGLETCRDLLEDGQGRAGQEAFWDDW